MTVNDMRTVVESAKTEIERLREVNREMLEALEAVIEWERDYRLRNHLGLQPPHPFIMAARASQKARQ